VSGDEPPLAAGSFSAWLAGMRRALAGEEGSEVPCHGCSACCTSSQFVHIGPDEVDTLAHIPPELLFPAPRLPRGHVVLGYDGNGHCPMLVDGACSIYEHRPRACRTYDCRVFPATGIEPDEDKPAIARRVKRWRFDVPAEQDMAARGAVRAAAAFVSDAPGRLPADVRPVTATQRAVVSVELSHLFERPGNDPCREDVAAALRRRRS
jgi:uncharacterized protein